MQIIADKTTPANIGGNASVLFTVNLGAAFGLVALTMDPGPIYHKIRPSGNNKRNKFNFRNNELERNFGKNTSANTLLIIPKYSSRNN